MKTILVFLIVLLSMEVAYSQFPGNSNPQRGNDESIQTNTNVQKETGSRDSTTIVSNGFFDIFYGNPGRAAFYGLIIPGGGQIYNKKWWKLPFVYGVEGGTIYWIYISSKTYGVFQEAYINNLTNPSQLIDVNGVTDVSILKSNRDKWRKNKEYSWIIFIGGHLITIFESFIDRHLMEFDVSDDLTFQPIPSPIGIIPAVTYTIPLNRSETKEIKNVWVD